MKETRLENLYKRRLVTDESAGRTFPEKWVMGKELKYHPAKPANPDFDILEIGPGRGDFLFYLASENPDQTILAIERGSVRYLRLVERLKKLGHSNVTLIGGDARVPFATDLQNARFKKIYVLFPDPWPRNRHRHMRLLNRAFTTTLCEKLAPQGEFTLATDVEDYARWVMGHCAEITSLKNIQGDDTTKTPLPDLIPTFFEKKWRDLGRVCHYVRYQKQ